MARRTIKDHKAYARWSSLMVLLAVVRKLAMDIYLYAEVLKTWFPDGNFSFTFFLVDVSLKS